VVQQVAILLSTDQVEVALAEVHKVATELIQNLKEAVLVELIKAVEAVLRKEDLIVATKAVQVTAHTVSLLQPAGLHQVPEHIQEVVKVLLQISLTVLPVLPVERVRHPEVLHPANHTVNLQEVLLVEQVLHPEVLLQDLIHQAGPLPAQNHIAEEEAALQEAVVEAAEEEDDNSAYKHTKYEKNIHISSDSSVNDSASGSNRC